MKKCSSCGQPHEQLSQKCRACVDKENVRQKIQYQERLKQNLCPRCGDQPIEGSKHCSKCKRRVRDKDRRVRFKRSKSGLCGYCGHNPPTDGLKTCKQCLVELNNKQKSRIKRLNNVGLCIRCGKFPQLSGTTRRGSSHTTCRTCYLINISKINLGSTKYADALEQKLKNQNHLCPYTGEKLVLGNHTWIDHIMPRSRFPELAHDVDNIEWVTETVNRMKQDQTPDEFLALIKQIHDHRSL